MIFYKNMNLGEVGERKEREKEELSGTVNSSILKHRYQQIDTVVHHTHRHMLTHIHALTLLEHKPPVGLKNAA